MEGYNKNLKRLKWAIWGYADKSSGSAAPAVRRANAYANDDAVKIYELTINVEENYNGIITPTAVTVIAAGKWYTLDGRCVASPLQKGIYITNGCKLVLKWFFRVDHGDW